MTDTSQSSRPSGVGAITTRPSTVVVFDYNWGGRIPAYHRLIVETALRAGFRVVSLSGASREVSAYVGSVLPAGMNRLIAPVCPELGCPPERERTLAFLRWLLGGYALWSKIRRNPSLRMQHALNRWAACRVALGKVRVFEVRCRVV